MKNLGLKTVALLGHYFTFWHIKRLIVFLIADVFLLFFIRKRNSNTVFILKCDLLGDYLINRNLLTSLRSYQAYQDRKIVLCANVLLRDFIETYDRMAFDSFIWIDRNQFLNSLWPRFKMLRQIKQAGAKVAINTIYYREPYISDCIMRATCASERIGRVSVHDPLAMSGEKLPLAFALTDIFYTKLIPESSSVDFDFNRNKAFLTYLLPGIALPQSTKLDLIPVPVPEVEKPFAIIMPGASTAYREWNPKRFAHVARYLFRTRSFNILILGTESDREKGEAILAAAKEVPMENLCGRLSLPQITCLASQCAAGLTNDSGGIHLFAALDKPAVAVSSTSSFGICHPYPNDLSEKIAFVYPPEFYELNLTFNQRKNKFGSGRHYSMEDIPVASIVDKLETLLQEGKVHESLQDY